MEKKANFGRTTTKGRIHPWALTLQLDLMDSYIQEIYQTILNAASYCCILWFVQKLQIKVWLDCVVVKRWNMVHDEVRFHEEFGM